MRGSSRICVSLTVVAMSWVLVLTAATASPTTVMASSCTPTDSVKSSSTVAPTGTVARTCAEVKKPDNSAVTSYGPGTRPANT